MGCGYVKGLLSYCGGWWRGGGCWGLVGVGGGLEGLTFRVGIFSDVVYIIINRKNWKGSKYLYIIAFLTDTKQPKILFVHINIYIYIHAHIYIYIYIFHTICHFCNKISNKPSVLYGTRFTTYSNVNPAYGINSTGLKNLRKNT